MNTRRPYNARIRYVERTNRKGPRRRRVAGGKGAFEQRTRLQRRLDLEALTGTISSRLLGAGAANLESEVQNALADVGNAYGVDYSFIYLLGEDHATIINGYEWHADHSETLNPSMVGRSLAQSPWILEQFNKREPIIIPDDAQIPRDAEIVLGFMHRHHVRGIFYIPLAIDNDLIGFCGLHHRHAFPIWDSDDILIHKLIGETLAGRLLRAQVETRLANERTLLRSLIDNVTDTLYAKDVAGRFIAANRAAPALVNLTPETIVGQTDFDLFEAGVARQYFEDDQTVIRTGLPLIERIEIVPNASGEKRWFSTTKVPLRDASGAIIGVVGIGRDITDSKQTEEALRESEARFRSLFNGMSEGVALHSIVYDGAGNPVDYRILDVNPQFVAILGIRRENVVDKLATEVYGTPAAPFLAEYALVVKTGRPYQFEAHFAPLDKHFYISVSSIGEGRFATLFFDITERQRVEYELRTAEANYRTIYENAVMGIFQSTPSGRYLTANPAMARIYGYDSAEQMIDIVGSDIAGLVYVDSNRRNELCQILNTTGMVNDFVSEDITREGKVIWTRLNARTTYDADGNPLYYEGFLEDITERKMAEQALRESEERFRVLAENSRDIIWTMNNDYEMTYCSPAIRTLLGYGPEEALKGYHSAIFTPESLQVMRSVMQIESADYARGVRDKVYHIDIQHHHQNGSLVWVDILVQRIVNANGEKMGLLGVSRDITARKQAEEKLQYLSTHDALTGLFNRACFEAELARVDASGMFPVSIIMADIDGLKIMNDRNGHAAGDQLLLGAAHVLRTVFRANDIVARIGGDELAVLLPATTAAAANAALQRLRAEMARFNTEHPDSLLSISMGVATAMQWNRPDELVSLADARMYEDKQAHGIANRRDAS